MNTTEARGKAAFFEEGFGRLGKPASRIGAKKAGMLYEQGWGRGMTQAEAQAALERRWEALSPEVKDKYAMRGGDGAFAPSEIAAAGGTMGATRPVEGVPAMLAKPETEKPTPAQVQTANEAVNTTPRQAQTPPAVNPDLPTDERMNADPAVKAAYAAKRAGVPASIARPAEPREAQVTPFQQKNPDGQRVMGDVDAGKASATLGTRINVATGMPFGYVPGAALPADADAAMKQRAADSVARQKAATGTPMFEGGVAIPKAVAVDETPKPMDTSMFASDRRIEAGRRSAAAADAKFMAGSNDGLRAVGPKKPLDELVRGRIPFARR